MTANALKHAELTIDPTSMGWAITDENINAVVWFTQLGNISKSEDEKMIYLWIDVINPPYFPSAVHSGAARETL